MTTSNSSDFSISRDNIIKGALRLVGALAIGETPTADQVTEASEALNLLVKSWQADGMPLWARGSYDLPLTLGTAMYTIGTGQTVNIPKPLKITQAILHDTSSNVDIPMRIITRDEYLRLGNKTIQGQPIQIYYDPKRDTGELYVFPPANSATVTYKQIRFTYQKPFEDFDASTDTPDFPQEWYEALKYGLATRLAGEYGITLEDRNQLLKEAMLIKEGALGFGTEEGSFFITADYRKY
jgi:hypothetical protein